LVTAYVLIRSVFFRLKEEEPGRLLSRAEASPLWALAESVAQAVHTRPVDVIYVTPGVEVGVSERGSLLKKLRGAGQRRLILGLGALPDMTQSQFQAILAHEYGHFLNRDTAGGNLAQQVRGSLYRLVFGLASSSQAVWYNPAWLFINGFYRLFFRLTEGASRLQEIMADRQAALTYGVQNFIDGLLHIVKRDVLFQWQVNAEVERTAQPIAPLSNLYALPRPESGEVREKVDAAYAQVMARPTSPYDSHPAVQERIELVRQLDAVAPLGLSSSRPVWDLLPNVDELQQAMTSEVQRNVDAARNRSAVRNNSGAPGHPEPNAVESKDAPTIEEPPAPIATEAADEDWECDACGALVPADAAFCPKCGAAFTN
jgi:Zn-dependent protease with chaperone function